MTGPIRTAARRCYDTERSPRAKNTGRVKGLSLTDCKLLNAQEHVTSEAFTTVNMKNVFSGMLRCVALVRTDVSEELSASFIRVTRLGELFLAAWVGY
jgi:hypothetical protein